MRRSRAPSCRGCSAGRTAHGRCSCSRICRSARTGRRRGVPATSTRCSRRCGGRRCAGARAAAASRGGRDRRLAGGRCGPGAVSSPRARLAGVARRRAAAARRRAGRRRRSTETSLLHGDVRSDNLCLRDGHAVIFDWSHARIGNPDFDVAFWLPSLALEGGPQPDAFGVDAFAVFVAGFFAALAGLPPPEGAPHVRGFQLAQLEVALPWACRALGLTIES